VAAVQKSSDAVTTGFNKTFSSDLNKTVSENILSIEGELEEFAKLKGYQIQNFQSAAPFKSTLRMFSDQPSTVDINNKNITTYQYYPESAPGTALNVLTTTANEVALN
jgi:hypothetical protein